MTVPNTWLQQSANGKSYWPSNFEKAPITSGNDRYIVWWANVTDNHEIMFRASE